MICVVIQEGQGTEAITTVRSEWQALFAETTCAPFMAWEWMSAWFGSFGADKEPIILKAYSGEKLVAILPLFLSTQKFLGMKFRRLSFIGDGVGGADHLDIIAKPEHKHAALTAILEYLQREFDCQQIRLESLAEGSNTLAFLKDTRSPTTSKFRRFSESITAVCPQIDLAEGWESVLARSKRSDNFRRRLKKLTRSHDLEFRSVTEPSSIDAAFERFLGLHEQRWSVAGGSELTGHPRLIEFQRRVVQNLSQAGLVRFDELWVDGKCASSVYGLDNGRAFYYYNSGYDLKYSHLSVGLVLLGLSVKSAIERGNTLYDFLRGDEGYKFDWANRTENLVTVSLHDKSLPVVGYEFARQGVAGFRSAAKSILPVSLSETLGNWRRAAKRNYQMPAR